MDSLTGIVKKRSVPRILIFDMKGRLLFFNKEAYEIVLDLPMISNSGSQKIISKAIFKICNDLKKSRQVKGGDWKVYFKSRILRNKTAPPYLIRAFFIGGNKKKSSNHIMVLIEKIIEKHDIDYEKAQIEFKLSGRELEVLRAICKGLSNKEISKRLFITEYTVKDHMKKILRKMDVTSRNQIITSLK